MRGKFVTVESGLKDTEGSTVCCGACYLSNRQRRIACACLWTPIAAVLVFILAVVIRTAVVEDPFHLEPLSDDEVSLIAPSDNVKLEWARRLGDAIKIRTISYNDSHISSDEFKQLHELIIESYPAIHSSEFIQRTVINEYSVIYRVEGSVPTKNPYMLCAHLDVVPEGKLESWSYEPFLGKIIRDEGTDYIFGRGAIDDKQSVFGILEALEHMLGQGIRPQRTFYLAFGHDEELSGFTGAANIAKQLDRVFDENNEKLDFMLDEGMFVMQDVFPGVDDAIIYIGVVEKGWAIVELSVDGIQGHASKPPRESAVGILARAVADLEENRQPTKFGESVESDTFEFIAPHANFLYKMVLGNSWLFSGLLSSLLSKDPATDAIQRTTTAVTLIQGGVKVNVVPSEAHAFINFRIHPAQTIEDVVQHCRDVIEDDRVNIRVVEHFVPSRVSSYAGDSKPFQIVANSARQVFTEGHIVPGIMIANTDTRHYQHWDADTFRFSPTFLKKTDLDRFHGLDERISVDNYAQVVEFYYRVIKNADYDVKEKPDVENLSAVEGSGISSGDLGEEAEPEDLKEFHIVDQNLEVDNIEGSSEL